jgi:hypothetical protein
MIKDGNLIFCRLRRSATRQRARIDPHGVESWSWGAHAYAMSSPALGSTLDSSRVRPSLFRARRLRNRSSAAIAAAPSTASASSTSPRGGI